MGFNSGFKGLTYAFSGSRSFQRK